MESTREDAGDKGAYPDDYFDFDEDWSIDLDALPRSNRRHP
jgi:hypothetical protein